MSAYLFYSAWCEDDIARLDARRKAHIRQQEAMLSCGKAERDPSFARFFSREANAALKLARAATLALKYVRGDAPYDGKNPGFPAELLPMVMHEADCAAYGLEVPS